MRLIEGKAYHLLFYDHFLGDDDDDEISCEVMGWVINQSERFVRIAYWKSHSKKGDKTAEKDNREYLKIIKSTIIKAKRIDLN